MSGVVIVATESPTTSALFHHLDAEVGVARVVVEQPVGALRLLRGRVRRLGIATALGQAAFRLLAVPVLKLEAIARCREIIEQHELDTGGLPAERIAKVRSINDEPTIAMLQALAPDVVVVAGTRIISERTLDAVQAPFLNMHAGMTPRYRGVHGGYWALAQRDPTHCGVTVHLVDPGVDTGPIVAQSPVATSPRDNFTTYPLLQLATGMPMMSAAVRAGLRGELSGRPPAGESRQWFHPTLCQYLRLRRRCGVR